MDAPRLRIRAVELFERPVRFLKPFRFGAATVEAAPQAFVRALVAVDGRGEAWGATAEMMMPKWFDKDPSRTPAATVDGLRRSLALAAEAYRAAGPGSAFAVHAAARHGHQAACLAAGETRLTAAYGPALLDKAVLDGLLRVLGVDVFTGMAGNAAGLDARLTPDLAGFDLDGFLRSLTPLSAVCVRHTVGLLDDVDALRALGNGGPRYLKIKLSGDPATDIDRLKAIVAALGPALGGCRATLDGNEQYPDTRALAALVDALETEPELASFSRHLLYIEQPIARERALVQPLGPVGARHAFIIDEADDSYDAFPAARDQGYRGVSSKSCKGLYKALLNAARCRMWNGGGRRFFISAEDLTCQAGLAVQQDTALVALLGIGHAERNGHHYVDGFADAPAAEAEAFLAAHPDLYTRDGARVRLDVDRDSLPTASLAVPGFAHAADPRWDALQPLATPSSIKEPVP